MMCSSPTCSRKEHCKKSLATMFTQKYQYISHWIIQHWKITTNAFSIYIPHCQQNSYRKKKEQKSYGKKRAKLCWSYDIRNTEDSHKLLQDIFQFGNHYSCAPEQKVKLNMELCQVSMQTSAWWFPRDTTQKRLPSMLLCNLMATSSSNFASLGPRNILLIVSKPCTAVQAVR
jgi:hypothetical protein